MSNEDLIKPRYRVIADFPDNDYEVGAIIPINDEGYYEFDPTMRADRMDQYPAIYQKLNWWEKRDSKEVESVDFIKNTKTGKVYKVDGYSALFGFMSGVRDQFIPIESERDYPPDGFIELREYHIPATEQEYNDFINQKEMSNTLIELGNNFYGLVVHEGAEKFYIEANQLHYIFPIGILLDAGTRQLPSGNYSIVGLAKDLSVAQKEKIVEKDYFDGIGYMYANYMLDRKWTFGEAFHTSDVSFESLLRSKGLNPTTTLIIIKKD